MFVDRIFDFAHPVSIAVIGAGGTGSQVLMHLARIHKTMLAMKRPGLFVTVWDDDIVTESNMGRQLFTQADLGEYKGKVLIERINRFFGTLWDFMPYKATDSFEKTIIRGAIFIGCVDNVEARVAVKKHFTRSKSQDNLFPPKMWIDAGNTGTTGQVIVGCPNLKLPDVFEVIPNLAEFDIDQEPSCSIAEAIERQDLFINSVVAMSIANIIWDMVRYKKVIWSEVYINLEKSSMINRVKADPHEPNQLQVHSIGKRRNNRKATKQAGKKPKKARARRVSGRTGARSRKAR